MKLYEISALYDKALNAFSEMDIDEQTIHDTLEGIIGTFEEKAISVCSYIKNLEAEMKAMREYEISMQARRKVIENNVNKLKKYVKSQMDNLSIGKIHGTEFDIVVKRNPPAVHIIDENKIPEEYFVLKKEVDKSAIKEDLSRDLIIPGVELKQEERLEIK
jgi:hypothetical protein